MGDTPGRPMGEQWENARPETVRKPTARRGMPSASSPAKTSPGGDKRQSAIFKIADSIPAPGIDPHPQPGSLSAICLASAAT
jgi:hypothetical protein